jgi:hypothetical protein
MPNPVPAPPTRAAGSAPAATAVAALLTVTEALRNRRVAPPNRQASRPATIPARPTATQPHRRAGGRAGTPTAGTASSAPDDHDARDRWHVGPGGTVRTKP